MKQKLYSILFSLFLISIFSPCLRAQDGSYVTTGYFFHPTLPRTINLQKTITLVDSITRTYQTYIGDLGYLFQFSIDSSNHLTNWVEISGYPPYGNFMSEDNPGNFSYYPDTTSGFTSDVYNNTYNPQTHTFYMHYGYNTTGDTSEATFTRQIYEQYVLIPKPVITSFSPASGTRSTQIIITGSNFTNAFRVYFGGIAADSFKIVSDSKIMATVGGGRTGLISVYNLNNGQSGYTAYSADSFFYTSPLVRDTSWHPAGNKGFSAGAADYVSIAMDTAGLPYVVYQDKARGNAAVVMHLDTDSTWKEVGSSQASVGAASFTNIAIGSDNVPYVAYIDSASVPGTPAITVSKYTGGSWQTVGTPSIDTFTTVSYASNKVPLALDSANLPYVLGAALTQYGYYNFHVHKFNGTSWEVVGGSDVGIESGLGDASMAIDKLTNTIYVVSDNGGYGSYQGIVARYNANNGYWDTIPDGFITNNAVGVYYPGIAVNKFGTPSISFQDDNGPEQISVYDLIGNSFLPHGNKYFSGNHAYRISLTISQGGVTPFVFYTDGSFNGSGTVMTPNINGDGSWQYLGSRGFAPSTSLSQNAIVTDKMGIPYVAFADSSNGYKATVLKYGDYDLFVPRTRQELYSDSACRPWVKSYPDWTNYYSHDTMGTHIEMQTQLQDEPGNLCDYESYIDSSIKGTYIDGDSVVLFPRSYRFSFSQSPFVHPVGIRLFATTAELNELISAANANGYSHDTGNLVVYRYDGPNEDYRIDNNTYRSTPDTAFISNYTRIEPTVHYYGSNDEYCYVEFYTNSFSEFHIGIPVFGLLPVRLLTFSAALQNGQPVVSWQTADEINTSYFTVQRSIDGVHFTSIGKVNAAGTGGNYAYSYQDNLAGITSAKVYYRLQTTDKDGSTTTSRIVSVPVTSKLITIQPNPAHSYAVITCNATGKKTITVTDMNGRHVFVKTTANNSETIPVSSFAKGLYLVRIDYTGGFSVQKLMIE